MHRRWGLLIVVIVIVLGGSLVTASYVFRSGTGEGRPNGMTYAAVVADINSQEQKIIEASKLFSLPPRFLGASIAAERAHNFQPFLEDIGDAIFGTSVGIAQVSTVAFKTTLAELYEPDSAIHFRAGAFNISEARKYFHSSRYAKRYERKLRLLLDTRFDLMAAAMILRHTLDRYEAAAPQYDVYHRPDLAATLYHRTFPETISGIPDEFGLMAVQFYNDATFMPRSVLGKEVHYGRRE